MTGLVWLQDTYCEEFTQYVTLAEALTTANGLASGDCGLSDGSVAGDWRLPNIRELLSLAGYGHVSSIPNRILPPGHPFLNVNSEEYWSSTTFVVDPTRAYTWFLDDAGFSPYLAKDDTAAIWPVRGPE